jgi:predicted phosphodiesterase
MLADIKTKYHLDYIIFGHTHKPSINGNIINPGSLTSPKQIPAVPTYILGESKGDGKFKFKIMEF